MTVSIDIRTDLRQVRRLFKELGPGVNRAAARALNDTITTVKAKGAREIKKKHSALVIGAIKKEMAVGRANPRKLTSSVATEGKPLPLELFKPSSKKRAGVTAVIGTNRVLMGSTGRRAFVIPAYGNGYFVRKSDSGRGVKRIRGPSLPGVFRGSTDRFKRIAQERWDIALPNRLKYEIAKAEAKASRTK